MFKYKSDGKARTGILTVNGKQIKTPFFMPVATKGAVKAMSIQDLKKIGVDAFISNSFILSLKPGVDSIDKHNGLHNWIKWNGGIATDSGGFQVLSKAFFVKYNKNGVIFKNPFTGQKSLLTPEKCISIQEKLGGDMIMCLDDVAPHNCTKKRIEEATERTIRWATRCKRAHKSKQALFGIIQGGINLELRKKCAKNFLPLNFDGYALGSLALGESMEEFTSVARAVKEIIPENKPLYVMGMGSPTDVVNAIGEGCDMFDSIFPTQNARRGRLFTREGYLRITRKEYREDLKPIEKSCTCHICKHFTRAYVAHLLNTYEFLGWNLATVHNLHFMQKMIEDCRKAILEKSFNNFKQRFINEFNTNINL